MCKAANQSAQLFVKRTNNEWRVLVAMEISAVVARVNNKKLEN